MKGTRNYLAGCACGSVGVVAQAIKGFYDYAEARLE
jgi:hypothetical protein